ncbi:uncharacterized protein LOC131242504 isoform X1 [Magnolia sinica]|uniref:uncharacterized protein LOC131242504 isoform X1 n=1 Tax=Magnolia sinica TaxID=86752 RepID=UPI0026593EAB|nr:uncharacterized protein LOC131242504 isoform X1 [Magnolia sinica]
MAAIHWYGPLINLSEAASHIGDYVQLLVFVHRSRPIQKFKASNGGGLLKTDIQVGDDTRSYFPMSLWQKHMASMIFAGDIVLLQNVKIVKFGDVLEAATVQFSSLLPLVHPFELLASKGVDELLGQCRVGRTTKEKLKKVVRWVQQTGSMLHNVQENFLGKDIAQQKNWKVHEERKSQDCISISELLCITESCNATFYACIGEIFLPFMWKPNEEFEKEKMFVSKRVSMMADNNVVEDLVCTGCKLCGSPIDFGSLSDQNTVSLDCQKSSNRLHNVCLIYRPFLLYVWDHTEHIPLLVNNKAAEVLFANIAAESVYACYRRQKDQIPVCEGNSSSTAHSEAAGESEAAIQSSGQHPKRARLIKAAGDRMTPNFHGIWLILLKLLLQQGTNSPLRFEVTVNCGLDGENGRFELVNLTMPCYGTCAALD